MSAWRGRRARQAADADWMRERLQRHDRRRPWPLSLTVLPLVLCLSFAVSALGLLYAKHGHTAASRAAGPNLDSSSAVARINEKRNDPDAQKDVEGVRLVVVVMPSPPMVSGPMTRIDRLQTIQDTWGRELVGKVGDSASTAAAAAAAAAGGGGVAGNNR